ncbi:hypothetical protein B597_017560 [Stutzerimonas stutzeri KOS6]|uniref:Uncharacterized protein n=1 Tax=Stutzerimonas stutzeri KOS6 TaxID=1218352 RepID=A0A061JNR7_STUST|nr:hypothetical protein B597_017560 [Stutzerimonas stutzeri KOS6]
MGDSGNALAQASVALPLASNGVEARRLDVHDLGQIGQPDRIEAMRVKQGLCDGYALLAVEGRAALPGFSFISSSPH